MRQQHEQNGPQYPPQDEEQAGDWIDEGGDAGQNGCSKRVVLDGRQVHVSENELVDEVDYWLLHIRKRAIEPDAREHAIAVEPVGFASQVVVGDRIAAVAHVHAAMQLLRYLAGPGDGRRWPCRGDWREVAGEVGVLGGPAAAVGRLGHGERVESAAWVSGGALRHSHGRACRGNAWWSNAVWPCQRLPGGTGTSAA